MRSVKISIPFTVFSTVITINMILTCVVMISDVEQLR